MSPRNLQMVQTKGKTNAINVVLIVGVHNVSFPSLIDSTVSLMRMYIKQK